MSLSQNEETSSSQKETSVSSENVKLQSDTVAPKEKSESVQNSSSNSIPGTTSENSGTKKRRLENSTLDEANKDSSTPAKMDGYVRLTIVSEHRQITAMVRFSTKIENLRLFVADKFDKDPLNLTLFCNERRCNDKDTIGGLGMEDGDVVTCVEIQSGG